MMPSPMALFCLPVREYPLTFKCISKNKIKKEDLLITGFSRLAI
jgi:hypothetical protein